MSATVPTREYVPVDQFLEANRDPITGRRRIGRDALYLGIRSGQLPHVRIGRRLLVPSDLLDQIASRPQPGGDRPADVATATSGPLTSDAA